MKKVESTQELQDCIFSVLFKFHQYCVENGLQYALSGGSCLGAVRHGDFIPWDDDADVIMPRPDYERFLSLVQHKPVAPDVVAVSHKTDNAYPYPYAKVIDTTSTVIENYYKPYPLGVYVDIFPIDGLPDSEKSQQARYAKVGRDKFILCGSFGRYEKRGTGFFDYVFGCIGTFFLHRVYRLVRTYLVQRIETEAMLTQYQDATTVGCVVWSYGWKREANMKQTFFPAKLAGFHGVELYIPNDYDTYLRRLYGDYMMLPPPEQRVTHDFCVFVDEGDRQDI